MVRLVVPPQPFPDPFVSANCRGLPPLSFQYTTTEATLSSSVAETLNVVVGAAAVLQTPLAESTCGAGLVRVEETRMLTLLVGPVTVTVAV